MTEYYDFIVVGAGAAGATVASRLARSKQRPSVLLVEAGGKNDSRQLKVDAERWITRMVPEANWQYKSVPIRGFNGSVIDLDRGKGLGGSTVINFACYTIGPREDHDEIARVVGDDEWRWENAQKRYIRLETHHAYPDEIPSGMEKYLNPRPEDHGHDGPLHIGFPAIWEPSMKELVDIWEANGSRLNPDHNSGDPIGMAVINSTAWKGLRTTSADELIGAPDNLSILTNTETKRLLLQGTKVVGIETFAGKKLYASKEVILSAGSLDTPRLLMYSGIGPADQLSQFDIPVVKANGNIGHHMKDHHHINLSWDRAEHTTQRHLFYKNADLQATAKAQWEKDQTGPLSEYACAMGIAYEKLDSLLETSEFRDLPPQQQEFLKRPTIPHYEVLVNGPHLPYFIDPANAAAGTSIFGFLLNMQSTGSVRLQSADPSVPLRFDVNYFDHPFDRRVAIELTRQMLKVANSPEFSKDTVQLTAGPASDSEEDILEYWRKTSVSTWHMMGTARMGRDESDSVVDTEFRVFGIQNLRVADMSVVPIAVNNHTQSTAFLTGLMAGDKLVTEYGLDE